MRIITNTTRIISAIALTACSYEPTGQWEAMDTVDIYKNSDHPLIVAFVLEKGEICAVSEEMIIRKDLGYTQVSCAKGRGWNTSGRFKKLTDLD